MNWKKFLLVGIGWGLGTAVGLALIVGGFFWYQSRPKPPKVWNSTAISCSDDAPGFNVSSDGKQIRFSYTLQNATDTDYQIAPETEIRITFKNEDGSLTEPLPKEIATLRRPIFIPTKQKAILSLLIVLGDIPQKKPTETDNQYHERLRVFCKKEMGDAGFVLFDEGNRYQINLPTVRSEKTQKPS